MVVGSAEVNGRTENEGREEGGLPFLAPGRGQSLLCPLLVKTRNITRLVNIFWRF